MPELTCSIKSAMKSWEEKIIMPIFVLIFSALQDFNLL